LGHLPLTATFVFFRT